MDIGFEYTKKRKEFGKHPNFQDSEPIEIANININDELKEEWCIRPITTTTIDCIPLISSHYVNTERYIQKDTGMSHTEGGWPKDVKIEEFSDKQRYIRKLEMDDSFNHILLKLAKKCYRCVRQNNSIDMYQEYFINDNIQHSVQPPNARTISILKDIQNPGRTVSKLVWHPDSDYKIATLFADLTFQSMNETTPLESYIWNINNPNKPLFIIKPTSHIVSLAFNKKNTDTFICGEYNGLVQLWDLRKGNTPIESSKIEKTHKDPVYDVKWIQSRTGTEFVSVSTDGYVYWWDSRKLSTGPMDELELKDKNGKKYGGTCLEYRTDAGATKFLIGTESGNIILVERKPQKGGGSTKLIKCIYGNNNLTKHHGPIYGIERNYCIPKSILTVGDWQSRIWLEEIKTPIMNTGYSNEYLTACCWSPTRCGVFFNSKKNGEIDIWDYYYQQTKPVYKAKISENPITSISINKSGKFLAASSENGVITIVGLSKNLYTLNTDEKVVMNSIFEREGTREKTLQMRLLAQKKKEISKNNSSQNLAAKNVNNNNIDDKKEDKIETKQDNFDIYSFEKEFLKMLNPDELQKNDNNNNDNNNNDKKEDKNQTENENKNNKDNDDEEMIDID